VQTTSLLDAGGKLPLVVQFVDSEANVARVLPRLREMAPGRLITLTDVELLP
jgi:PII-like signaling protein